jgi:hypothetical protein
MNKHIKSVLSKIFSSVKNSECDKTSEIGILLGYIIAVWVSIHIYQIQAMFFLQLLGILHR